MKRRRQSDYPPLSFTAEGGPLDGMPFQFGNGPVVNGGRHVDIALVLEEGIRISTIRRSQGIRVPVGGKYRLTLAEDDTYRAVHEPSALDRYYQEPPLPPLPAGVPQGMTPPATRSTLDLAQVPPALPSNGED